MKVRAAHPSDRLAVLEMGRQFYATAYYSQFAQYDDEAVLGLIDTMIGSGVLLVADNGDELIGMVGLCVVPFLFNPSILSACEVMWWVDPTQRKTGAGVALLRGVEPAVREKGAQVIQMIHLESSPAQAGALYERLGFERKEHSYMKVL